MAIAVLPFANLGAGEGDVLASGIAESVLHQLASLAELDVISRTSSFAFRGRATDARDIGRQLGARFLLEGTVQSDHRRMRVTTHLIDTETGADIWSMRFDRLPGDIFAVQDEIAMQVTQALELSLDARAKDRLTGQGTQNLQAYLAFLQGRSLLANNRSSTRRRRSGTSNKRSSSIRSSLPVMCAWRRRSCLSPSTTSPMTGRHGSSARCFADGSSSSRRSRSIRTMATRTSTARTLRHSTISRPPRRTTVADWN